MAEEQHARLGPSNHRWPNCPGSVREEAAYPDISGEAAIDGTGSHLLLEECLNNNCRAEQYDQQIIGANHPDKPGGWLVGLERVERVQMCLDYLSRRVAELKEAYPGARVIVESESKSDPGSMFGRNDWWGTVDITITVLSEDERCLFIEVIDYKDGRGWVHEKDNTQLISYAAGKMRPYVSAGSHVKWPEMVGGCRLTIVQPKTNPPVRYDEPAPEQVVNRAIELAEAAARTDDPDAPLIPDDKGGKGYCRWCKHKPNCTANAGAGLDTVKSMVQMTQTAEGTSLFEQLEHAVANVKDMTGTQLADLLDTRDRVNAIYDKVAEEVEARVRAGHQVPGYIIGPGQGSRVWNFTEEEVAKKLKGMRLKKGDIYPEKLISPAQALKIKELTDKQKERIEKELISFKAGKDTLKKVARERQERPSAELMFASVPRGDEEVAQSSDTVQQSQPPSDISFI